MTAIKTMSDEMVAELAAKLETAGTSVVAHGFTVDFARIIVQAISNVIQNLMNTFGNDIVAGPIDSVIAAVKSEEFRYAVTESMWGYITSRVRNANSSGIEISRKVNGVSFKVNTKNNPNDSEHNFLVFISVDLDGAGPESAFDFIFGIKFEGFETTITHI